MFTTLTQIKKCVCVCIYYFMKCDVQFTVADLKRTGEKPSFFQVR